MTAVHKIHRMHNCVLPVKSHDDQTRLILRKLNQMDEKLDMVLRKLHQMSKAPAAHSSEAADDSACLPDGVILPLDSVRAVNELDSKLRDTDTKRKLVSEIFIFVNLPSVL